MTIGGESPGRSEIDLSCSVIEEEDNEGREEQRTKHKKWLDGKYLERVDEYRKQYQHQVEKGHKITKGWPVLQYGEWYSIVKEHKVRSQNKDVKSVLPTNINILVRDMDMEDVRTADGKR